MKKILIACMAAVCILSATSCKKDNPAEDFVGNYNVTLTPTIAGITLQPQTTTATIVLDGDEGNVKCTMFGATVMGNATDNGLQLDPTPYSSSYVFMGATSRFDVKLTHELIQKPDAAGKTTWEATMSGQYTVGNISTPIENAKVHFEAIKR